MPAARYTTSCLVQGQVRSLLLPLPNAGRVGGGVGWQACQLPSAETRISTWATVHPRVGAAAVVRSRDGGLSAVIAWSSDSSGPPSTPRAPLGAAGRSSAGSSRVRKLVGSTVAITFSVSVPALYPGDRLAGSGMTSGSPPGSSGV